MSKKVRMLVQISGTRDGKDWPKIGEDLVTTAAEAEDLIKAGIAADPGAAKEPEIALADLGLVETATAQNKGNKAVNARLAAKPAPHADEKDAYHVPPAPGEVASAKAGQKEVDAANKDREEGK